MDLPDVAVPILVVIPCLNEERYIGGLIADLLREADRLNMKIVAVDGGSTDRTPAIVRCLTERDSRVMLLDNTKKFQSAAVNGTVKTYGSEARFLLRLDAHVDYPDRYCECLLAVQAKTGADAVVVSMHATGRACFQRAAAAAQNSFLGNGGSPHRNRTDGRWVEHGHHALISIPAFEAVGGYDETFSHNEDADLDIRLIRRGYRIFLSGEAPITYYPRESATMLFRQYFNFGCGRARNIVKNHCRPAIRQMLVPAVAPAMGLLLLLPLSSKSALPALGWSPLCLGYGIYLGFRLGDTCAAASGFAAMVMHSGWSLGFYKGLIQSVLGIRGEAPGGPEAAPSRGARNLAT